ncbi:regulator of MON1-CCZ1 complex-like isoform X2 [Dreissena polymorpha]|uniref:regulator of MON1-CCZ1 complex-like isoform X2 n=1 Tax=Dreissena polymorpha TaxID=45954 RepID=UPI0022642F11|nr:regulator of MON1-CCZ1 complex-like isoform X2 [Dreissena polymorpha]
MASDEGSHYIELCNSPIKFEPISKQNNVFYDDANQQVFTVRSGGSMGVVVKGPNDRGSITFRMEDRGNVNSMKFSPDRRILAIQRSPKSVEFINFHEDQTTDTSEYSQTCKGRSTEIKGFVWTNVNEIVFITGNGAEFYQINPDKRSLKNLKSLNLSVVWYVWMSRPDGGMLLLSSGQLANALQPVYFIQGSMLKLPKFEVDLPALPKQPKQSLLERDVTMAYIYGQLYIIVLRHQPRPGAVGAEVVLYMVPQQKCSFVWESPAKKTNVLKLEMSGRFAINVVDSLVVVHHQASKTSVIFDIQLDGDSDGFVTNHFPVVSPLPIKPFKMYLPTLNIQQGQDKMEYNCELYSANWIVFQPNIVIDAKLGCLWSVELKLEPLVTMIPDKCRLVKFLLQRQKSKVVILDVFRQMLMPGMQVGLPVISRILDMLNDGYMQYLDQEIQALAIEPSSQQDPRDRVIIDQSDMYTNVFAVFEDNSKIPYKFKVAVLIEYIRSLSQRDIPVQHYVYELLINTLVHNNCFYQLHQFLQYHVLSDSKPLACLMLSLETEYPPAHQLALDMLTRLATANEEIIEVLLSKNQLLPAVRFIRKAGITDTVSSRKFLEAAMNTLDKQLFFTVFKFFQQRNIRLRGSPVFHPGEHCEIYVKHFEELFGTDAIPQSVAVS